MTPSPNVIRISDVEDPRLARYKDLRTRESSNDNCTFIAEGRFVVDRLIDSNHSIESLLIEDGKEHEFSGRVAAGVPSYCLPRALIEHLVGFDFHRGVIACGRREPYSDSAWLAFSPDAAKLALAVIGVEDQENMGSLMRSAAALGINQILLGPKTIDPFRRRVIRVSMANVLAHRFYQMRDPVSEIHTLASQGFRPVASTLDEATELGQFKQDHRPIILIVGNEARGIDPELQQLASDRVRIPMHPGCDSLNVAVAAAIMMYELTQPRLR